MTRPFLIERGLRDADHERLAAVLREYEAGLGISLCFQNFQEEVAGLPGQYAPPRGEWLLLRDSSDGTLAGCVGLRPAPDAPGCCEMKRLYVRSGARGRGLGRRLAEMAMATARELGYRRMCLDTLPQLREAQALYRALGFRMIGMGGSEPQVLLFERDLDDLPRSDPRGP